MRLKTFTVGPLATNCYLVWDDATQAGFMIDPGENGDFLSEKVLEFGVQLEYILLTHGHFDHVLGLLPLKLNFPSTKIYLREEDRFLYDRAVGSARHFVPHYSPDPLPPVDGSPDAHSLRSTTYDLRSIPTPGHTPGSACYYLKSEGWLFTGDTLFKGTVGATDHAYSRPLDLSASLGKLFSLPGETIVYPGHGEETTLRTEK